VAPDDPTPFASARTREGRSAVLRYEAAIASFDFFAHSIFSACADLLRSRAIHFMVDAASKTRSLGAISSPRRGDSSKIMHRRRDADFGRRGNGAVTALDSPCAGVGRPSALHRRPGVRDSPCEVLRGAALTRWDPHILPRVRRFLGRAMVDRRRPPAISSTLRSRRWSRDSSTALQAGAAGAAKLRDRPPRDEGERPRGRVLIPLRDWHDFPSPVVRARSPSSPSPSRRRRAAANAHIGMLEARVRTRA